MELSVVDVTDLCKHGKGDDQIICPFALRCGTQRTMRMQGLSIWFAAHQTLGHAMPKVFGNVGRLYIDESPVKALTYGTEAGKEMTLPLDVLLTPVRWKSRAERATMMEARKALYAALDQLDVPEDPHRGVPVTREILHEFFEQTEREPDPNAPPMPAGAGRLGWILQYGSISRGARFNPAELGTWEWRDLIDPKIRPDMDAKEVRERCQAVADNARVDKMVKIWELLGASGPAAAAPRSRWALHPHRRLAPDREGMAGADADLPTAPATRPARGRSGLN